MIKLHFVVCSLMVMNVAWAADPVAAPAPSSKAPDSLAKAQAQAQQQELQKKFEEGHKAMVELERLKALALQQLRSKAKFYEDGAAVLTRSDVTLSARYVDSTGKFVPGKELSADDVRTINQIFHSYFRSTPFEGRISAGYARKVLAQGLVQLAELKKVHENPTEENSPELEIFAQQIKERQEEEQRLLMLAERLGLPINNSQFVVKDPKVQ